MTPFVKVVQRSIFSRYVWPKPESKNRALPLLRRGVLAGRTSIASIDYSGPTSIIRNADCDFRDESPLKGTIFFLSKPSFFKYISYMILREEIPLPEEYCKLRAACGMSEKTVEAARIALPRSLYSVTVRDGLELVGMGRIIGDLGCHVQIADIAVHPSHQKRGISHDIMQKIMNFIENNVPECAFVNLFADVDFLYQKYGFAHGNENKGMYLRRTNTSFS